MNERLARLLKSLKSDVSVRANDDWDEGYNACAKHVIRELEAALSGQD